MKDSVKLSRKESVSAMNLSSRNLKTSKTNSLRANEAISSA